MPNYNDDHLNESMQSPPVTTAEGLEELAQALRTEPRVAVDTEADSLYVYFEKVCLIQFSTLAADYLVDPLAIQGLKGLAPLFADPAVEKIFHACEYDILCLKRDGQLVFNNIYDTMIAARILGWKNVGLGNILQEHFGIVLNKKLQRADWGHRPLTAEQLAYAREDTHYLLGLRDLQIAELDRLNRLEEAREEFVRLTRVEPNPRLFDPDAYWKIKGARSLNPAALGILRELYRMRDGQARKENRPPFKVLTDAAMLTLSETAPMSRRDLGRVRGISEYHISRFGETILAAITRGFAQPQNSIPHPNSRHDTLLDNAARARLDRLKEWRTNRAAARGVEPDVIASNEVLIALARHKPKDLEEIRQVSELGRWKMQEYGGEMLNVLNSKK